MADAQANVTAPPASSWRSGLVALALAALGLLSALYPTARSLYDTWLNSETYTHGLLILPITLWLVWQKRTELAPMRPRPTFTVLPLLAAVLLLWALAILAGVQVVEQLALVASLILVVWAVIGHRIALYLAFPLLFLFFGVPMGEDLVPPLMEFTATFTVELLQLTGIPVYREGLHFEVPGGSWSVVEACSGVRYLIASVTLGFLYAYLAYQTLWKRLLFIALSAALPILANGLRAYMIVMIGYLSDMRLAVGVDHLIYGWLFFGLVMLLLFWIGSFWSEPHRAPPGASDGDNGGADRSAAGRLFAVAGLAVGLAVFTAGATAWSEQRPGRLAQPLVPPPGSAGWVLAEGLPAWDWRPTVLDAGSRLAVTYRRGDAEVTLFAVLYPKQRQDAEAVSSQNQVLDLDSPWRIASRGEVAIGAAGLPAVANRYELRPGRSALASDSRVLHLWQWYRLGAHATPNSYVAKLYSALNLLYPGRTDGAYVLLAAMEAEGAGGEAALRAFAADMGPALHAAFETAVLGAAATSD